MDVKIPGLIVTVLLGFAWYQVWYVLGPKNGWPPGWPISKIATLCVPAGLAFVSLFLLDSGGGMAANWSREIERTAPSEKAEKQEHEDEPGKGH